MHAGDDSAPAARCARATALQLVRRTNREARRGEIKHQGAGGYGDGVATFAEVPRKDGKLGVWDEDVAQEWSSVRRDAQKRNTKAK